MCIKVGKGGGGGGIKSAPAAPPADEPNASTDAAAAAAAAEEEETAWGKRYSDLTSPPPTEFKWCSEPPLLWMRPESSMDSLLEQGLPSLTRTGTATLRGELCKTPNKPLLRIQVKHYSISLHKNVVNQFLDPKLRYSRLCLIL